MVDVLRPRTARLVRVLLEWKGPASVERLSRLFGVSSRTLRCDLKDVKRWVEARGMTLVSKPKVGIKLAGNPEKVLRDLTEAQKPSWQVPLSMEDRRNAILIALLQATSPISLATLADGLFVSRSTIKTDITVLRDSIRTFGLLLKQKPGVGHYV